MKLFELLQPVQPLMERTVLHLRDFDVTVGPHASDQWNKRNTDIDAIEFILRNISSVKHNIMGMEPGASFILHDGHGTGLGMRKHNNNRLTLATTFQVPPGFVKGKHPTFKVVPVNKGITQ